MKARLDFQIPAQPPTMRNIQVVVDGGGTMSPYFAWFKHLRALLAMLHVFQRNGLPAVRSYVRFDTSTAALAVPGIEPTPMMRVSSSDHPVGLWIAEIQLLSTTRLTEGVQPILNKYTLDSRHFYGQDQRPSEAWICTVILEAARHLTHEVFMLPESSEGGIHKIVLDLLEETSTTRRE